MSPFTCSVARLLVQSLRLPVLLASISSLLCVSQPTVVIPYRIVCCGTNLSCAGFDFKKCYFLKYLLKSYVLILNISLQMLNILIGHPRSRQVPPPPPHPLPHPCRQLIEYQSLFNAELALIYSHQCRQQPPTDLTQATFAKGTVPQQCSCEENNGLGDVS
jgi:hypothetical protein